MAPTTTMITITVYNVKPESSSVTSSSPQYIVSPLRSETTTAYDVNPTDTGTGYNAKPAPSSVAFTSPRYSLSSSALRTTTTDSRYPTTTILVSSPHQYSSSLTSPEKLSTTSKYKTPTKTQSSTPSYPTEPLNYEQSSKTVRTLISSRFATTKSPKSSVYENQESPAPGYPTSQTSLTGPSITTKYKTTSTNGHLTKPLTSKESSNTSNYQTISAIAYPIS
ncbi:hypothetical protein F5Y16DRAFT_405231 [Xylariaceae sp. FL0255]|nr:hypothetical protein F5Y16DRAFT_405231 [Xylariaceae sp. FL0255]